MPEGRSVKIPSPTSLQVSKSRYLMQRAGLFFGATIYLTKRIENIIKHESGRYVYYYWCIMSSPEGPCKEVRKLDIHGRIERSQAIYLKSTDKRDIRFAISILTV